MTDSPRSLLPLSRLWRGVVAVVLIALAVAHVLWPELKIDAVFLGLLGAALGVLFFDIESFEWHGITARRLQKEIQETEKAVQAVQLPTEPPKRIEPPKPGEPSLPTLGYQGTVHREPVDLMPPVERLERLLWAVEQIRIELIVLAGNGGVLREPLTWDRYTAPSLIRTFAEHNALPPSLGQSILKTLDVRNRVVHAGRRIDPDLIASAADLALDVLNKLRSIKREYHRIREPDVMVYKDQSLSVLHDTRGVMLVQLDASGKVLHLAVYPRLINYIKGRFVSWEWNSERAFRSEGWYHDPASNQAKVAWSQSATFVGREYPQQWGIEYSFPRPGVGLE